MATPLLGALLACSAQADDAVAEAVDDSNLVDSELTIEPSALAHELQWVDKQHALVGADGSCRYVPPGLVGIDTSGNPTTATTHRVRDVVQPSLARLIRDANAGGARVSVLSAYRDFDAQVGAYARWADECVSAYPGHSEHQLGTTVDLAGVGTPESFSCTTVASTERWLVENAHRYGFSVSYPKCNGAGYRPEPWHLRWVGASVATAIFRARTAQGLAEAQRNSVAAYDFFACHSRGGRLLPFVTGHVSDSAAPNDLLRTATSADGSPASTCRDAGRRHYRAPNQCLDYCAGQGNCAPHDLDAICRIFPRVRVAQGDAGSVVAPPEAPTFAWSCETSRWNGGQIWTCASDSTFRAKCEGDRPVREMCPRGCASNGLGREDTCR